MSAAQASPLWRPLAALTALVTAAHVLVLQASPDSLGLKLTSDTAASKAFATRRIEARPEAVVVAVQPEKVPVTGSPVKKAVSRPKIEPDETAAQQITASTAIDSIANLLTPGTSENPVTSTTGDASVTFAAPGGDTTTRPVIAAVAAAASAPTAAPARVEAPKPTLVTAVNLPGSARLQYKMTGTSRGLSYYANAELNWNNAGSQYEAAMKVSAMFVGSRSMSSVGRITPSGLAPTRFSDKSRSELAVHFDADKGKITFSANTPDAPWMEGAQDRVSVFMQLAGMLAAGPTPANAAGASSGFPVGSSITVYTLGPREADTWTFVVEAEEKLTLPYAELNTLKLSRKPRREYDQKVEVWYAPSLGYLPVRNRITQQNGDFIDQVLAELGTP